MKYRVSIVLLLLIAFQGYAQKDRVKFVISPKFGYVPIRYDEIKQDYGVYSNSQTYSNVESTQSAHKQSLYKGLNFMVDLGFQIPVYRSDKFSVGVLPKVGLGHLFQLHPNPKESYDDFGWPVIDEKAIGSPSSEVQALLYARYSFNTGTLKQMEARLFGGYKLYKFQDRFLTPVVGGEFGWERFTFGFYYNILTQYYYRQLSNQTLETAKTIHEFGVNFNIYIWKDK